MKRVVYYKRRIKKNKRIDKLSVAIPVLMWLFMLLGITDQVKTLIPNNCVLSLASTAYFNISVAKDLFSIVMTTLVPSLIFCMFSYIMSLSCFGMVENLLILALFSFISGHALAALYINYGFKGILFTAATQIPVISFQTFMLIKLSKSTIKMSFYTFENVFLDDKKDLSSKIKKHSKLCVRCALYGVLLLIVKISCYFVFSPYIHL